MGVELTDLRVTSGFDESSSAAEVLDGVDLGGHAAVVTGASSGVGAATAKALAASGAEVILAVRDAEAGARVAEEITSAGGSARVEALDLLELSSIKAFAARLGPRPLRILVNNAGVMGPPFARTADGFEVQMAVHAFGLFALTRALIPNLIAATPSRVVMVSSGAHHMADLDLDDLDYARMPYEKMQGYGRSKTATNLLAVAFDRRFGAQGVTVNALTPGAVTTNLGRHVTFEDAVALGWVRPDGTLPDMIFKTPEQGAATSVWAAVAPELEGRGSRYLEDCQEAPPWSAERPLKGAKAYSLDPARADALWAKIERIVDERWSHA